jgi:O-antigen biosynthesis protein
MSNRPRVFGMVNMQRSWEYTSYAIKTFAKYTDFSDDDILVLIDDDGSFGAAPDWILPRVELITNSSSRSFAQNINQVMAIADERSADLYFFHNDVIFTENWSAQFRGRENTLLVPQSNDELHYQAGGYIWKDNIVLTEYTKRAPFLREVVKLHRAQMNGFRSILSTSFFCCKIPAEIYKVVGQVDTSFGRMGGECHDYCLRALKAGFKVEQVLDSYILHFGSKSTEGGNEKRVDSEKRIATYRDVFEQKWGKTLRRLIIDKDLNVLQEAPEYLDAISSGDFAKLVLLLEKA